MISATWRFGLRGEAEVVIPGGKVPNEHYRQTGLAIQAPEGMTTDWSLTQIVKIVMDFIKIQKMWARSTANKIPNVLGLFDILSAEDQAPALLHRMPWLSRVRAIFGWSGFLGALMCDTPGGRSCSLILTTCGVKVILCFLLPPNSVETHRSGSILQNIIE